MLPSNFIASKIVLSTILNIFHSYILKSENILSWNLFFLKSLLDETREKFTSLLAETT